MRMLASGKTFMDVLSDDGKLPVFSEAFLYPAVGKGDARFILAVAEEYEALIRFFGEETMKRLLDAARQVEAR